MFKPFLIRINCCLPPCHYKYTFTKCKWKDIQLEQIKHFRITSVDIIVDKPTGMLGLHHGQSVLICEICRKKICTIDGMLDSIKELHFYCFCHGNIYFFFKSLQIKFKGSTTNYDPDAFWYISTSSITTLEALLLIIISCEHF